MEKGLQNYVEFSVKSVIKIKQSYGYRVVLKYMDGSEKVQQKSGFKSEREAKKARDKTIAELYSGTYIVYPNVTVDKFMEYWLEEDIKKRITKQSTYETFSNTVKKHIVPFLGQKKMEDLTRADVQHLYNDRAEYSLSVAKLVKAVMNISMRYAVSIKAIIINPAVGINLPKSVQKQQFHTREIDTSKTLSMEQIQLLIQKSEDTPIHMQVLLSALMGLRCSEMNAVKYSDIDYINRTLTVQRQLGKEMNAEKENYPAKTFTKQEIGLKTGSSYRVLPIPDIVFDAILKERKVYEKNRSRRSKTFQDLDYICCSSYGRPRSKDYHWVHYKKLLEECGLPDIRWHDLRSSFCTMLLKNDFSPKAVSKLLGHAKEIVTIDVYADNKELIVDGVPELQKFIDDVIPPEDSKEILKRELLDIVVDTTEYLSDDIA